MAYPAAKPGDLPPLGDLVIDDPMWHFGRPPFEGYARLRVWKIPGAGHGRLAVATHTETGTSVTNAIEEIWAALKDRHGLPLVLLEHWPGSPFTPEHLDQVKIGSDGSPKWFRIWPALEEDPRNAELELWMAAHGDQIVYRARPELDWLEGDDY
jgi:hypothetical protein